MLGFSNGGFFVSSQVHYVMHYMHEKTSKKNPMMKCARCPQIGQKDSADILYTPAVRQTVAFVTQT